jgi:hypothetical protein
MKQTKRWMCVAAAGLLACGWAMLAETPLKDASFTTFGKEGSPWSLQLHNTAKATVKVVKDGVIHIESTATSTDMWHGQLFNAQVNLKKGVKYSVSFKAKGKMTGVPEVLVMKNGEPYNWFSEVVGFEPGEKEETYRLAFTSTADEPQARLTFQFGKHTGHVEISDLKFEVVP